MDGQPPSYEDVMSGRAKLAVQKLDPPSYNDFIAVNAFVKRVPFLASSANQNRFQLAWKVVYCVYKAQKPFRRPPMCNAEELSLSYMNHLLYITAFLVACEIYLGTSEEIIIEKVPNLIFFIAWKNNAVWVPAHKTVHQKIEEDDAEELFRAISNEIAL
jgi:hypothetical protein